VIGKRKKRTGFIKQEVEKKPKAEEEYEEEEEVVEPTPPKPESNQRYDVNVVAKDVEHRIHDNKSGEDMTVSEVLVRLLNELEVIKQDLYEEYGDKK